MADNVVDLALTRMLREAETSKAELATSAQRALDALLCVDIRQMDGRRLRKIRDQILLFRSMLAACSREGEKLIVAEVGKRDSDAGPLTPEETIKALRPVLAHVSVRFA